MRFLTLRDQFTRTIVGFGLQAAPLDGVALCRMFNQAIAGQGLPARLSLDHDPLFTFQRWQANLRILEIEEIQTVPYAPVSHPFIERFIGTLAPESIWTTVFSGTSMTWKRSWRLSGVITTGRVRTKGWRATRRRKRRTLKGPNLPTSTTTPGSRTAMGYSNCQSPHE